MAKRTYETDAIRVHWNSELCIHTARCLAGLPEVFNNENRPWITVDAAEADRIAETIETCPSGALWYERLDGADDEQAPDPPVIVPRPNGPLSVRGRVTIQDAAGGVFETATRATLCRCGNSQNQPFCDNTHRQVGFTDNPRVISPKRSDAESPDGVS